METRFFDVIAVDFEFIKRLGTSYDAELTEKINKVTLKYKEDNLLDLQGKINLPSKSESTDYEGRFLHADRVTVFYHLSVTHGK